MSPGVIFIDKNMICEIGPPSLLKKYPNEPIKDLGEMVLFPGFVNAHCHLELTALGPLPQTNFVSWIKEVVRLKKNLSRKQIRDGITSGIASLLSSGVTTIGDHVGVASDWTPLIDSPLSGILFGEVLGLVPEVAEDIYRELQSVQKKIEAESSRLKMHISPHSVHAVNQETFCKVVRDNSPPLSCHLAESEAEEEYFSGQSGSLADFMRERGIIKRHEATSGLDYISRRNLPLEKMLIIHGNYLSDSDLALVKNHHLSIVHCPGSHKYFAHRRFPIKKYLDEGINIALGTDSIASNTELNFLAELRLCRGDRPVALTDRDILTMATLNGAKALRMEKEIGSLVPGKKADIVGFHLKKNTDPLETPFNAHQADFLMIDGRIVSGRENFF